MRRVLLHSDARTAMRFAAASYTLHRAIIVDNWLWRHLLHYIRSGPCGVLFKGSNEYVWFVPAIDLKQTVSALTVEASGVDQVKLSSLSTLRIHTRYIVATIISERRHGQRYLCVWRASDLHAYPWICLRGQSTDVANQGDICPLYIYNIDTGDQCSTLELNITAKCSVQDTTPGTATIFSYNNHDTLWGTTWQLWRIRKRTVECAEAPKLLGSGRLWINVADPFGFSRSMEGNGVWIVAGGSVEYRDSHDGPTYST